VIKVGKVALLDSAVINQIAAGEVVERPASVVKELIENAIDAQATQITVVIGDAGLKEIKVLDNGTGMSEDDARLALASHATSKIREISDLEGIDTLGFRGEALPSIASVSHLTLITRPNESVAGTRLMIKAGELESIAPAGCPVGTQVVVEDLFFNAQPRRKFLKSARTESGVVSDLVSRYALGYPEIAFRYYNGKRLCLGTSGRGNLLEAANLIYGQEITHELLSIAYQDGDISVDGLISKPGCTRASRYYQSFFVNRRLIKNISMTHCLDNAYWGYVTKGQFPLAVINIVMDPADTDVNAHPTKSDIRFHDLNQVLRVTHHSIRSTLDSLHIQPEHGESVIPSMVSGQGSVSERRNLYNGHTPTADFHNVMLNRVRAGQNGISDRPGAGDSTGSPGSSVATIKEPDSALANGCFFQNLRLIGQVLYTYIVAEGKSGVYFIDQHAAHERVNYEATSERLLNKQMPRQQVLSTIEIHLTPEEANLCEDYQTALHDLGFVLQDGGEGNWQLVSVPQEMSGDPEQLLREVIDILRAGRDQNQQQHDLYDRLATVYACKSAIKAGDRLRPEEMHHLMVQLDATKHPGNCPHGRPTFFQITESELVKRFFR